MKSPLTPHRLGAVIAVFCTVVAFAQNATLSSNTTALSAEGGTVILTAVAQYEGMPGALAWSIALPTEWALEKVAGPDVPAVASEPGATGTLEFAYTSAPAQRAEFSLQVRYPAGASAAKLTPIVFVRAGGNLTKLTPTAVEFRTSGGGSARQRTN